MQRVLQLLLFFPLVTISTECTLTHMIFMRLFIPMCVIYKYIPYKILSQLFQMILSNFLLKIDSNNTFFNTTIKHKNKINQMDCSNSVSIISINSNWYRQLSGKSAKKQNSTHLAIRRLYHKNYKPRKCIWVMLLCVCFFFVPLQEYTNITPPYKHLTNYEQAVFKSRMSDKIPWFFFCHKSQTHFSDFHIC